MDQKSSLAVSTIFLLLILTIFTSAYAQQAYTSSTLVLRVYGDGIIKVEYSIETDITYPRVNVTLFGEAYENLIVTDQNDVPIDYTLITGGIAADTLGANAVEITYFTSDLTSKSGQIWFITVSAPTDVDIILPSEATVISLNQTPTAIRSINGQTLLTMPAGQLEIVYTLDVLIPTSPQTPTPTQEKFPYWWILSGAVAAVAIVLVIFRFRKKPKPPEILKEKRVIDVEKIFRQKSQLRPEDREVIQFIAECGGETFEGEIRNKFKLPRTTVWRMIQRLKREEIADIVKTSGQNLIRIKAKYQRETA